MRDVEEAGATTEEFRHCFSVQTNKLEMGCCEAKSKAEIQNDTNCCQANGRPALVLLYGSTRYEYE